MRPTRTATTTPVNLLMSYWYATGKAPVVRVPFVNDWSSPAGTGALVIVVADGQRAIVTVPGNSAWPATVAAGLRVFKRSDRLDTNENG